MRRERIISFGCSGRSRAEPASREDMIQQYPIADRLPGWYFRARKTLPDLWDVEGEDVYGRKVSCSDVMDKERALERCIEVARRLPKIFRESDDETVA